jgi:hypothetical protein
LRAWLGHSGNLQHLGPKDFASHTVWFRETGTIGVHVTDIEPALLGCPIGHGHKQPSARRDETTIGRKVCAGALGLIAGRVQFTIVCGLLFPSDHLLGFVSEPEAKPEKKQNVVERRLNKKLGQ